MKSRNEETGELEYGGYLNGTEASFLLQFAMNALMNAGVVANLKQEVEEDVNRFVFPSNDTVQ